MLGFVLGVCVGCCIAHKLGRNRKFSEYRGRVVSVCVSQRRGQCKGLANVVLTSNSVRAQWRVIIGGRICLVWSGEVICCHRKRPDTGVSARSQFRVVSVSCLFVFLNRVLECFGRFSCSIRSGDVRFHLFLLEVCVGRVCVCKFCANANFRENSCAFCHPS